MTPKASTAKVHFFPTVRVHCLLAVASPCVLVTLGPSRWKSRCGEHGWFRGGVKKTQEITYWLLNLLGSDACQFHLHVGGQTSHLAGAEFYRLEIKDSCKR